MVVRVAPVAEATSSAKSFSGASMWIFAILLTLVGAAGVLLTRVVDVKQWPGTRRFVVLDAGMTELLRPMLYDAYHRIEPVAPRPGDATPADIVGPICESGDFLARERDLAVSEGDLLAILSAGAYGMTMSSNYNTRGRAAEVMVDGDTVHLIRERESIESLYALERLID